MSTDSSMTEVSIKTPVSSAPASPKSKVKFLCSYGGKILPRPADNHLKYVGGETRVISVPRDIDFSELMKKLTYLLEGEMVLKYQLLPEELDALISVKSDEDLRHMFEEYDRHANDGTPRLRAFLFPANPTVIENQSMEPQAIEQRYIDAINGIIRSNTTTLPTQPTTSTTKPTTINTSYPSFSISSPPCSSPRSPDSTTITNEAFTLTHSGRHPMHRVHSSPSIGNLSVHSQSAINQHQNPINPNLHSPHTPQNPHHYHYNYRQPPILSPLNHHHSHHHPHYPQQQQQQQSYHQPTKPPLDPHRGVVAPAERLVKVRSVGRSESSRYQVDSVPTNYYAMAKHHRGSMNCNKCIPFDDCASYVDGRIDRSDSLPLSPLRQGPQLESPHHDYYGAKPWDT